MIALAVLACLLRVPQDTTPVAVDRFEHVAPWTAHPADGVSMELSTDAGHDGKALRLAFDFVKGGGYAVAHRPLALDLPPNYAFSFWIRGDARPNTIEFKLIDSTGDNVWWYREPDHVFDGKWHHVVVRKRQIHFAWGPRGGGDLHHVAALELVVTAGRGGGSGSVWFDDLALTPRPVLGPYTGTPTVTASEALPGHRPSAVLDGDSASAWRAPAREGHPTTLTLDFRRLREFGGLSLVWEPGRRPRTYEVRISDDGRAWRTVRRLDDGFGARDELYLPNTEARYLRLVLHGAEGAAGYGLRGLVVQPLAFGASRNAFFEAVARAAPPGTYPRSFLGERPNWTVVGLSGGRGRGLMDEDGAVDVGSGAFSIEPFFEDSGLVTWHDVQHRVGLVDTTLPIPTVTWEAHDMRLVITAFATGPADRPSLVVRYRVINAGARTRSPTLDLAVRPFQVNPPWQFLGVLGGVARVDSVRWTGSELRVNSDRQVIPLVRPARVSASTFPHGGVVARLRVHALPPRTAARDTAGAASSVLVYPLRLAPGDSADVAIEVPLVPGTPGVLPSGDQAAVAHALADAVRTWRAATGRVTVQLPPGQDVLAEAMRTTVGWILVNRDGPAIQPGARAYARSWIRDGALISDALLRFGHPEPVRAFLDWYAPYQYADGKIPCCVDARGADPVPEDDSNGEFIYAVQNYWRHTHDDALLRTMWPHVTRAVQYLDSLRRIDRTAEFRTGTQRVFFGLLPPSISHEGYSAKPMHSYWDDFWAILGLHDAAAIARALGDSAEAVRFAASHEELRHDVLASIDRAMERHRIDYIPGAADLGDFDPTSTTIALDPVGGAPWLPHAALLRTFERYWAGAAARASDTTWSAYAGYEVRNVGAMLRLGWKARALTAMREFLAAREPTAWNQWPEVIHRHPRAPKFVGDLPHTWVGADFLRAAADLFVYERDGDSTAVLGAGIDSTWLVGPGVRVRGLRTGWGPVRYTARRSGTRVRIAVGAGTSVPPGGLVIAAPLERPVRHVFIDGAVATPDSAGAVRVRRVPVDVLFEY